MSFQNIAIVLLDLTMKNLLADPVLHILSILLCVGLVVKLLLEFRRNKVILQERSSARKFIDQLDDIGFFEEIDKGEFKLASYRLLRKTYSTIRETLLHTNDQLLDGRKSILNEDLHTLLSNTEELLFHPAIAQMLHDTEEMRIQKQGLDQLSGLKRKFHSILSKYDRSY
ncbi:MAG TPA: hypothetical protein VIN08_16095 [Ohtaekwangia sp.]|uniref:hypothetical protein n=1 Tax=Ohtaekwangia sp. TaxID=2066019 RepID=UPI002F93A22B